MFEFIKGSVASHHNDSVVLEAGGIGYRIFIPTSASSKIPHLGENLTLYVSFVIREFSQSLYGFLTAKERSLFETLLDVTGVGPKLALSIIGHLTARQLCQAIKEKELVSLCKVPGIGKKTAERLVIELKDKIPYLFASENSDDSINLPQAQVIQDALNALIHLGYTQSTAQKALSKTLDGTTESPDLAQLITRSLQNI